MRNKEPVVKLELGARHATELLRAESATEPAASVATAAAVKPRAASWESWDSTVAVLAADKSVTSLPAVPVAVKQALLDLSPYSLILAKPAPANPYAKTPSKVYKDWRVSGVAPERKPAATPPLPGLSEGPQKQLITLSIQEKKDRQAEKEQLLRDKHALDKQTNHLRSMQEQRIKFERLVDVRAQKERNKRENLRRTVLRWCTEKSKERRESEQQERAEARRTAEAAARLAAANAVAVKAAKADAKAKRKEEERRRARDQANSEAATNAAAVVPAAAAAAMRDASPTKRPVAVGPRMYQSEERWLLSFAEWKRKHRVPASARVFSIGGGYDDLRQSLLRRGWFENPDQQSLFWDLRWSIKARDVDQTRLHPSQVVNHFARVACCITTKAGLLSNLTAESRWFADRDANHFFPRAYNLNDASDFSAFVTDFRWSAALALLKKAAHDGRLHARGVSSVAALELALAVAETRVRQLKYLLEDDDDDGDGDAGVLDLPKFSDRQWCRLLNNTCFAVGVEGLPLPCGHLQAEADFFAKGAKGAANTALVVEQAAATKETGQEAAEEAAPATEADDEEPCARPVSSGSNSSQGAAAADCDHASDAESARPDWASSDPVALDSSGEVNAAGDDVAAALDDDAGWSGSVREEQVLEVGSFEDNGGLQAEERIAAMADSMTRECIEEDGVPLDVELRKRVYTALAGIARYSSQSQIDGSRNVWVLKPAGKSRGRGIRVFNRLDQIMHYIGEETPDDHLWVAQKYMENPLLIKQRKFDIRQWVLVTNWNPLTVWFYSECYIRFCAEPFTLRDLDNTFIHLTNNSVAKHSDKWHELNIGEGNMWDFSQFQEWLRHTTGGNEAWEGIATSMRDIARQALMCAQGEVQSRKGSCELFGFDFCFDDAYKVWLIEINCSPSLEHSTPITSRLVSSMLEDAAKVLVDLPEQKAAWRAAGKGELPDEEADTGRWECIHRNSTYVPRPMNAAAVDLVCVGRGVGPRRPWPKQPPVATSAVVEAWKVRQSHQDHQSSHHPRANSAMRRSLPYGGRSAGLMTTTRAHRPATSGGERRRGEAEMEAGEGELVPDAIAPRALRDILDYDPSSLTNRRRSPLFRRGSLTSNALAGAVR